MSPWRDAEEITFECEPGTLTGDKLSVIRDIGVTRLSLGVENFDDEMLELNGRAHRSPEVFRAYEQARALGFPQINIDLIAGMLGETEENWQRCVEKTLELAPDSITIYQMELPFNTTISSDLMKKTGQFTEPVADWATKRRWVREAFEALERAGYHVAQRLHRDEGSGADDVRLHRSSLAGRRHGRPRRRVVRARQRRARAEPRYLGDLQRGREGRRRRAEPRLPADGRGADDSRARAAVEARIDQAVVLPRQVQVNVLERFREQFDRLAAEGYLATATEELVALTRDGLLRVDVLLRRFFQPQHADVRYT